MQKYKKKYHLIDMQLLFFIKYLEMGTLNDKVTR